MENCLLKQSWLRCSELIKSPRDHIKINNKYYVLTEKADLELSKTPKEWLEGLDLPQNVENLPFTWHLQSMLGFFDKYGIEFFEPLEIWHIKELEQEFIRRVGRKPKPSRMHIYLQPIIKLRRSAMKLVKAFGI